MSNGVLHCAGASLYHEMPPRRNDHEERAQPGCQNAARVDLNRTFFAAWEHRNCKQHKRNWIEPVVDRGYDSNHYKLIAT
jgi:hypothetical protein